MLHIIDFSLSPLSFIANRLVLLGSRWWRAIYRLLLLAKRRVPRRKHDSLKNGEAARERDATAAAVTGPAPGREKPRGGT